ncbi:MAG: 2Fe-2S iron-sulfur cluster-binding protein [Bacteroidetes bacterium]|nr:2Fe-2S iron-sulfur cluster-binding protein [Bacteroidota bacterium]MDA0874046.1 2Fe-2S iron-sulfur cluster-binding protein [Bacteroidota bacterium]
MAKVTIDHQTFEYEGQQGLLQFCLDHGVDLPHFCYHPAMSAPANCRQCLVEVGMPQRDRATGDVVKDDAGNDVIQFMPKLQTSCSMQMADGMVVKTHRSSELVKRAQKDTLEFLLINHPLDCPICDQAGHCPLQNQAYKHGPEGSRFEFEKVHKPKHIDLGPRVVLDGERCINCTRCVRFTREVSESHQLTIIERGVRNYPMTPPGVEFDEPYSMNVIDICPVGALTSKDHRFKARIWEMSKTPSVSTVGAKGSNVDYWVKDNQIMKVTPRTNMEVNEYWLADEERLDYRKFNEDRPEGPTVEGAPVSWDMGWKAAADCLQGVDGSRIVFLGSAWATVEDNYLLGRLAAAVGASAPVYLPHVESGHGDNWLRTDDRTPNAQGCERLGIRAISPAGLKARLESADVLYVMEDDPVASGACSVEDLAGIKVILHHYNTTNQTLAAADVALPAAMAVETVGTYVNMDGHAQRLRPAKAIAGVNRTLSMEIGKCRADRHGTPFDKWYNESNLVDCQPGWVSLPEVAAGLGHAMAYKGPKQIMEEVSNALPSFKGATYPAMGEHGVRLETAGVTA